MRANTPFPASWFATRAATILTTWLASVLLLPASGQAQTVSSGSAAPAAAAPFAPGPATGAISGLVVDAAGAPVAGALVFLSVDGVRAAPGQSRQLTDELGRFAFVNLPPSPSYSVSASRPGFRDGLFGVPATDGPSAPIAIGPGEWFSKARVSLARAPVITGLVTDERGEPVVNAYVRALARVHIAGRVFLVAGPLTTTDDRGAYRLSDLAPGQYLVQVPSVQGSAPAEMSTTALAGVTPQSLAAYEASGRTPPSEFTMSFDLTAQVGLGKLPHTTGTRGRPVACVPHHLTITITNAVPTLSGTVQNTEGLPAAGAAIIAFPVESERWSGYGQSPRRLKTVSVATNGSFQLTTLPAGDYFVVAVPAVERMAWQDPAYLRRMSALATRVHLAWGETATQALRLVGDAR